MQKGNIGVTTENIFPVIKKFLYSDHEIFLPDFLYISFLFCIFAAKKTSREAYAHQPA